MKSLILNIILALGAVATCGTTLHAQSSFLNKADIPFAFQVAGKTWQAGKYTVRRGAGSVPMLTDAATSHSAFISGGVPSQRLEAEETGKLVFRCYKAGACYLAAIWPAGQTGIELPRSKAEKESVANRRTEVATIAIDLHRAD